MFLALFGHSFAGWIAGMEFVGLDESQFFVPGFGLMATIVAGEPEAVTRDHDVIAKGLVHL